MPTSLPDRLTTARPEEDPLERARLRAELASRLLGEKQDMPTLGRYELRGPAGEGAMGVVYSAHDPELDRPVALKVVAPGLLGESRGQTRLLREARALAAVSHPNIVTVFDAGAVEDRVWIAMELVEGVTLRAWLAERTRSWREILPVLIQAARGLAAAHEAGLLHRDFKPDNAMVDADGRCRVTDFGLAAVTNAPNDTSREASEGSGVRRDALGTQVSTAGAIAGTMGFIAPEVLDGARPDERADQYAWCVVARDAMPDAPRWLHRVIARGLEEVPEQRWSGLAALILELERGGTRGRRRRVIGGLAGVVALAGLVAGGLELDEARRVRECERAGEEIRAVWNDAARERVRTGMAGSGVNYADGTFARVVPRIDDNALAWSTARIETCLDAEVRGVWDDDLVARADWCLGERRQRLAVFIERLETASDVDVRGAVLDAERLRSADECRDEAGLRRADLPPPDRRDEVAELRRDFVAAVEVSRTADPAVVTKEFDALAERARALGWVPLQRAITKSQARAHSARGDLPRAEELARTTYFTAADRGDWEWAADGAVLMLSILAKVEGREADAHKWNRFAESALDQVGDREGNREFVRLNSMAAISRTAAKPEEAIALSQRAIELGESFLGPDHYHLGAPLNNMGVAYRDLGNYAKARECYERALALKERALGPDHPDVAMSVGNLGNLLFETGDVDGAIEHHQRSLAAQERAFGPDDIYVGKALVNLAAALGETGEQERRLQLYQRARTIFETKLGPEHRYVALVLENLANLEAETGDLDSAENNAKRALAILEATIGGEHPDVARVLVNLGHIAARAGDSEMARSRWQRALTIREAALGPEHPLSAKVKAELASLDGQ